MLVLCSFESLYLSEGERSLEGELDRMLLRLTVTLLVSNVREAVSAVALKYLTQDSLCRLIG